MNISRLSPKNLYVKSRWTYEVHGIKGLVLKALSFLTGGKYFQNNIDLNLQYEKWLQAKEPEKLPDVKGDVLISIVIPVYEADEDHLREALDSVLNQIYENWELCVSDDASELSHVKKVLDEYSAKDKRIKVNYRKERGHICRNSNDALAMAGGEFVALMDNDDILTEDALLWVVSVVEENPGVDMIYSDEDKLFGESKLVDPFFKPDFSPDLIMSMMYPTHFSAYRRTIIEKIGGFRPGYEGSQDYDLFLRFWEEVGDDSIYHISKILYHWRKIPGSTADQIGYKSYAITAAKKALTDSIDRREIKGEIIGDSYPFRLKREVVKPEKVTIVIPTRNLGRYLKRCIEGIDQRTRYKNFEILVADNDSDEKKTIEYLDKIDKRDDVKVVGFGGEFNFSKINNAMIDHADGDYILFLNNDTEPANDGWLEAMVEHVQRDEIGAVGPKLVYPNGMVQSAGLVMGLGSGGIASSPYYRIPKDSLHYFNFLNLIRNVTALTAACMMIRKGVFEKVGGFDEDDLPVNFQDVDLCLKLLEAGYLNVYTPYSEVVHYESLSRDDRPTVKEDQFMRKKWKKYLKRDPYYNPNLSRDKLNFYLN